MQWYDPKSNIPLERTWRFQFQGTGAAVPTMLIGHGVTISRPAIGRLLITFLENPGTFVGFANEDFRDATQANVKGWTCTGGVLVANANGTWGFEVDFWTSVFAAADLAATSFLDLGLIFSELAKP